MLWICDSTHYLSWDDVIVLFQNFELKYLTIDFFKFILLFGGEGGGGVGMVEKQLSIATACSY